MKSQIIKYSLCYLLKPEWLAKAEFFSGINENKKYLNIISRHLQTALDKCSKLHYSHKLKLNSFFGYKNNKIIDLTKKINSNRTISRYTYILQSNQNFINKRNDTSISVDIEDSFQNFIRIINFIGLEWYIYINLHNKHLFKKLYLIENLNEKHYLSNLFNIIQLVLYFSKYSVIESMSFKQISTKISYKFNRLINFDFINIQINKNSKFVIKPNSNAVKLLSYAIRSKLYNKNYKGVWRIKNRIAVSQANLLITALTQFWLLKYSSIMNLQDRKQTTNAINKKFYLWQQKKQKR